jgi:hypothetical protein
MGLNRTPTAILESRGSFIGHKNRKEARAGEPVVTKKLGGPPKTFTDEQKKLWREFAKIVPAGVATYADRWAVEIVVCAMAKFPAGTITGGERSQLTSLLSKFGLTPADRSRVVATLAPEGDDGWSDLDEPQQLKMEITSDNTV